MRAAEELGANRFSGHRGGGFGYDRQVQPQPPVSLPPAPCRQQQGTALLLALGCWILVVAVCNSSIMTTVLLMLIVMLVMVDATIATTVGQ